MHVAKDLLRSSELGVAGVPHRVGYDSEEAFSRAFKCETGWHAARGGSPTVASAEQAHSHQSWERPWVTGLGQRPFSHNALAKLLGEVDQRRHLQIGC